ncbi:MAG: allantoate amidohydrolase [Arenicellales bacterium]|nr:allantoate amidohydrolase [Arenicellales bacterium]
MDHMTHTFQIDGAEIMARIEALAEISETPTGLTRRYLTEEHRRANNLVAGWMRDSGMQVREDAVGNIIGRYEGNPPGASAVMVGSHLDTVVSAGKYDGALGVLTAISCVQALCDRGIRLPFAIEVIGFADEEGVRFSSTFLGSRAVAGTFDRSILDRRDAEGISMAEAMHRFGLDPELIGEAARRRDEVLGYLEVHIEQGPVLENESLPVGTVTTITGACRLEVIIEGIAGHAGTVPMSLRCDALATAGECVLAIEALAKGFGQTVATVGQLSVEPGAINVIPGRVRFTVDIRAATDEARNQMLAAVHERVEEIVHQRRAASTIEVSHDANNVACTPSLMEAIDRAIEANGWRALRLPSGAGHDGSAMASITDIGMIFVRCKDGVSHNPDERITHEDAAVGANVLLHVLRHFKDHNALSHT